LLTINPSEDKKVTGCVVLPVTDARILVPELGSANNANSMSVEAELIPSRTVLLTAADLQAYRVLPVALERATALFGPAFCDCPEDVSLNKLAMISAGLLPGVDTEESERGGPGE